MIRAILYVVQGAIAGMVGMFIVGKGVDVATDERVHRGGRACCSCLVLAFGLFVIVLLGWGLWDWISKLGQPDTYLASLRVRRGALRAHRQAVVSLPGHEVDAAQ